MTRGHQERIGVIARQAALEAGVAFADLDRIGVTVGPGSFTGLRVGLAFAKGLATALSIPCVGVTTLEAMAYGVEGFVAAVLVSAWRLDRRRAWAWARRLLPWTNGTTTAAASMRECLRPALSMVGRLRII